MGTGELSMTISNGRFTYFIQRVNRGAEDLVKDQLADCLKVAVKFSVLLWNADISCIP